MDTIADCQTPGSVRVRDRLSRASSVEELWFLRSDIYEVVTRVHCQREAGHRVNALLPAFDRLMPERLLRQV